jgi:hypothetical protein
MRCWKAKTNRCKKPFKLPKLLNKLPNKAFKGQKPLFSGCVETFFQTACFPIFHAAHRRMPTIS